MNWALFTDAGQETTDDAKDADASLLAKIKGNVTDLIDATLGKLSLLPDISNKKFPEARKFKEKGLHRLCSGSARPITDAFEKSGMASTRRSDRNSRALAISLQDSSHRIRKRS